MIRDILNSSNTGEKILLFIVVLTIFLAEYMFLNGNKLHGIFVGLWAPTILGFMNFFRAKARHNE